MRNVDFHVSERIVLHIRSLVGELAATRAGAPPTFDDNKSFVLTIHSGEIALTADSLTDMMNTFVLKTPDSPLKNLRISIDGKQVKQTGVLKKGVPVPFALVADPGVTSDGKMVLRPDKMKMVGVPAKGLLQFFGLRMDDLVDLEGTNGLDVEGNDLIVDPGMLLPAPKLRGRLIAVRIEGDALVEIFGGGARGDTSPPPVARGNYMYYRGGTLKFGKLVMADADLRIIDMDPSDPFDFHPDRYTEQLVAGYSKTTKALGLEAFMPDYDSLAVKTRSATQ